MPKGDREILKADPEDGTTPIANLLLEALIIAKLTSKERAALLFLIRRTYGWQVNGVRLKEAKIPFSEWKLALSMDAAHTSTLLAGLEAKSIIKRRYVGPTGTDRGYYYSINTIVAEWSNSYLNQQLLREIAIIKLPKTVRKLLPKSVTTLDTNSRSLNKGKEILKKDIYKTDIELLNNLAKGLLPELTEGCSTIKQLDKYPVEWQTHAVDQAIKGYSPANWAIVFGILKNWQADGGPRKTPLRLRRDKNVEYSERMERQQDPDKYIQGKYGHVVRR